MELCEELEALLRQARPIFCDETALADVTVKGRANFVTRCDTCLLYTSESAAPSTTRTPARRSSE